MIHRGPDDQGVYQNNDVLPGAALGHRRLSILDLSQAGRQPMTNEEGSLWIVFNGEIYNFQELRKDLLERGHKFSSATDTEAVLHLYEEYGCDCVSRLRGMFAFAIWNNKDRSLFIARDRLGKKPLYYAMVPGGFYFASEIQALYPAREIGRTLDLAALDMYLTYSYIPSPHSIYTEIKKLPPASTLTLINGKIRIQKYWSLDYAPKFKISFDEAKEQLLELLQEATKIRLLSDVPLGCFLSGGIDSSTIVAIMSRFSTDKVKTFSVGFPDRSFDETRYARTVAEYYHTDHHEFVVEPKSVSILPDLVRHYGEPYADPSALPTWYLSFLTRKYVTVALNGDGGDESFAGYNWYKTGIWLKGFNKFCPDVFAEFMKKIIPGHLGNRARQAKRMMHLLSIDPVHRFLDLRTDLKKHTRHELYSSEMRKQLNGLSEKYFMSLYDQCSGDDELDRMLYTDVMSYLPEQLLVKVDRASMAHSLEARSPFLDHKVMEFAARLPSDFKIKNGRKKHLLLETVAPLFPRGFLERPKMGFSVPLGSWFQGELKGYVRNRIIYGKMADSGLFDIGFMQSVLDEKHTQLRDNGSLTWRLLMLAEWMEEYA
jgi:asparagine synthase (glutamine-hydrolysing)